MSKIHEIDLSSCLDLDFDDGRDGDYMMVDSKIDDDRKRRREDDCIVDLTKDSILNQFLDILYSQLYLPKYHKKNKKKKKENCLSQEDFIRQLFSSSLVVVDTKINEEEKEGDDDMLGFEEDLNDVVGDIILFIQPFPFFLYIHCLPLMFHLTRFLVFLLLHLFI